MCYILSVRRTLSDSDTAHWAGTDSRLTLHEAYARLTASVTAVCDACRYNSLALSSLSHFVANSTNCANSTAADVLQRCLARSTVMLLLLLLLLMRPAVDASVVANFIHCAVPTSSLSLSLSLCVCVCVCVNTDICSTDSSRTNSTITTQLSHRHSSLDLPVPVLTFHFTL